MNEAFEAPALIPPHGLEEILTTFGDIYEYIQPDGSLERDG